MAVRPGTIRSREGRRSPNQVLRLGDGIVCTGAQGTALFAVISRQNRRAAVAEQPSDAGMQQVWRERFQQDAVAAGRDRVGDTLDMGRRDEHGRGRLEKPDVPKDIAGVAVEDVQSRYDECRLCAPHILSGRSRRRGHRDREVDAKRRCEHASQSLVLDQQ